LPLGGHVRPTRVTGVVMRAGAVAEVVELQVA
jgi:hypothetical protein